MTGGECRWDGENRLLCNFSWQLSAKIEGLLEGFGTEPAEGGNFTEAELTGTADETENNALADFPGAVTGLQRALEGTPVGTKFKSVGHQIHANQEIPSHWQAILSGSPSEYYAHFWVLFST